MPATGGINSGKSDSTLTLPRTIASSWRRSRRILSCAPCWRTAVYWLNRKKIGLPETELVTVFCPSTITGPGETDAQPVDETRSVVDCKVNPVALAGHVK